ncbi:MAG TPA: response regulator [Cyanobacteria bacterium UBA8803]|nr:response regulator [Cyanobacteria bacterium UBA9273]HBL61921.1 response regulator [Cyanobacteria bacterium UBA8803]
MSTILAIDDDSRFLELLLEWLALNEFQSIGAEDGLMGLQLAQTQDPDLILCDVRMPEFDGYQVLKALRRNPATQNIPFIFITNEETDNHWRRARELGANGCLDKFSICKKLIHEIQENLPINA